MSSATPPPRRSLLSSVLKGIFILFVLGSVSALVWVVSLAPDQRLALGQVVAAFIFTPTPTPTATFTFTPSPTASDTPSPTPTASATSTPEPSVTPTPSLTPLPSATFTATPRPRPQPDGVQRTANVPILMYHYISAPPDLSDSLRVDLSVLPENFDAQMNWLVQNGYHSISFTDLYYYLAVGTPLPENPVIITLDDGYIDHYYNAFPILQKYGFTGTFFILAGPADVASPPYLTWSMITEMSAAGMDIQVHGRDHVDMRNRADVFLFFQIVGTRQAIEAHTGKPAPFFAYPSGRYDAHLLRFLSERDFWMAVTTQPGRLHTLDSALILPRVRIRGADSLASFASKMTSAQ